MPSSLTRVIPLILGFSPHLPVSVCGTGTFSLSSSFSRQCGFDSFHTCFLSASCLRIDVAYFTTSSPLTFAQVLPSTCSVYPPVSLHPSFTQRWYRNLYLLSIAYDHLVLGLGPDLPWADEPSPGNLRLSTGMFLACLALLIPAFSLLYRPQLLSVLLHPIHNAPLPIIVR